MHRRAGATAMVAFLILLAGCGKSEEMEIIPGLTWTMWESNPVLSPSEEASAAPYGYYNGSVSLPWVIKEGATYTMWFTATNTEGEDTIGRAVGPNGVDWTPNSEPVFTAGAPGSWEGGGVWSHCVIEDAGEYKMFYTGFDDASSLVGRIGLVYSANGIDWDTREPANPIIGTGPPGSWYENGVFSGTVLTSGLTYQMWFSGRGDDGLIRALYTTSTDCITWDTPQLVLHAGPEDFDVNAVFMPCVLLVQSTYHMWYTGINSYGYSCCCYATSNDGFYWLKHGVARRADMPAPWEAADYISCCVIQDVATFRMWYSAVDGVEGRGRIGYGTSPAPQVP